MVSLSSYGIGLGNSIIKKTKIDSDGPSLRAQAIRGSWKTDDDSPRVACVNSFGFGGSNAHAVIMERKVAGTVAPEASRKRLNIMPLSAHDKSSLRLKASTLSEFINNHKELPLNDIGHASALRQCELPFRLCPVFDGRDQLVDKLAHAVSDDAPDTPRQASAKAPAIVFVFSGMGQQWWGMARKLGEDEPVFRETIEECSEHFSKHFGSWRLMDELMRDEASSRIDKPEVAQAGIFSVQVALTRLWKHHGVIPSTIIGHSVGEVAATHAAGMLSLADAIIVGSARALAQSRLEGSGGMMAAGLSEADASELLRTSRAEASIAAVNSPRSVTFSGTHESLRQIGEKLTAVKVFHRILNVRIPYHGPMMAPLAEELDGILANIAVDEPRTTIISTVTGKPLTATELRRDYWSRNMREPVRFLDAINGLRRDSAPPVFVEVSAHPVLSTSIKDILSARDRVDAVFPSMRRDEDGTRTFLKSLAELWRKGCAVDWKARYSRPRTPVQLPRACGGGNG